MKTAIRSLGIKKAEYLGGYQIRLFFTDDNENTVDFKKFLFSARNPMITKYRDKALFSNFEIESGDLMWNDFEMSFDLEDLYGKIEM
jgi:hypothetical protein